MFKNIIAKFTKQSDPSSKDETKLEIAMHFIKQDIEFEALKQVSNIVAEKLADKLYPTIKDKIMTSPNFEAVINEIRLQIADKFNNRK